MKIKQTVLSATSLKIINAILEQLVIWNPFLIFIDQNHISILLHWSDLVPHSYMYMCLIV